MIDIPVTTPRCFLADKGYDSDRLREKLLIYDWNKKHRPAKEQARRDVSLLRSLLDSKPLSAERAEFIKLASQILLDADLSQALYKPIPSRSKQHFGRQSPDQ